MRRIIVASLLLLAGCSLLTQEHYVLFFQPLSSDLDEPAKSVIASLASKAIQRPGAVVTISGFADPEGGVPDNKKLAARRTRAVADALVADGLDASRIQRHPVGSVDYTLDSIESRRVEITIGSP